MALAFNEVNVKLDWEILWFKSQIACNEWQECEISEKLNEHIFKSV